MGQFLSLPSRILITIVAIATVGVGAMTMKTTPSALMVGGVFFFFVLAFTASLWAGRWSTVLLRVCAAIVPLAYLAYFIDTFIAAWPNLRTPASPGQAHWMNALGGLLIFGVPCAVFAVRGWARAPQGREQDPEAASDNYTGEFEDDEDEAANDDAAHAGMSNEAAPRDFPGDAAAPVDEQPDRDHPHQA